MSKQIDAYSFALGVCEAFCEVVRAGVKRIALSHPFTEDELQNALGADFLPACEAVARKYGLFKRTAHHRPFPGLVEPQQAKHRFLPRRP